jgi:hypothetical protein
MRSPSRFIVLLICAVTSPVISAESRGHVGNVWRYEDRDGRPDVYRLMPGDAGPGQLADRGGHVGVVVLQVGEQLIHRTAPARAAPEQQNLFGPSQRLGDGLVETLPFWLALAVSPLVGGVQVSAVTVTAPKCEQNAPFVARSWRSSLNTTAGACPPERTYVQNDVHTSANVGT